MLQHGLWDQVRVDCGREFALILYIQDWLTPFRTNTQRAPYVQTQSKHLKYDDEERDAIVEIIECSYVDV